MSRPQLLATLRRRSLVTVASAAAALALLPLGASTASAHDHHDPSGAVFVQLNGTGGNQIAAYQRNDDGTLAAATVYATGGSGGYAGGCAAGRPRLAGVTRP